MNTAKDTGMKIYFVRHGQTQNNLEWRMNTWDDDDPLTDKWREQALNAWLEIKKQQITIDQIISSNLDRAQETARIIAGQINYTTEIIIDHRLREQDGWVFKWKKRSKIRELFRVSNPVDLRKLFKSKEHNEIEDVREFDTRVSESLTEIQEKYSDKTILIVAHSWTSRPLLRNIQDLGFDFAHYEMPWVSNAEVIDLENHIIKN